MLGALPRDEDDVVGGAWMATSLASGLYEGDDEVRLDEEIPFTSSSAIFLLPNSGGSWLNSSVSGEAPAVSCACSCGSADGDKG
jgi:hypothetical protein